jgi:class 3 adenylate cyclase/predicted ATPase
MEDWLRRLGLEEHAGLFAEQRIDREVLPDLSAEDLEQLGIPLGHRKKLLKAIAALSGDAEEELEADSPEAADAERRQLTVMFCDLVGSTALSQRLDPEDLREINRAYQDLCKETLESYEGYIARYMGDGVLAYFGYPRAHEDDPERAILASLDLLAAMDGLNADLSGEHDLAVRIGVATGPVVVGDLIGRGASQESAVVGETPNVAARLQALAEPGAVVIAPGTHTLAGHRFTCEDFGTHSLKGVAEPLRTWRVTGRADSESRFEALHRTALTPLVGRDTEIALLQDRWQQARDGDGQVVVLTGEAGIGKSRIAETLLERTASDTAFRLRYQCSPHHANSELFPFVDAFQRAARFEDADPPEARLAKLEALLAKGADDVADVIPLFAALLSVPVGERYPRVDLSAEALKSRTLEALTEQLEGLSRQRPVLVTFEDAHWADPTSLELLTMEIEQSRTSRVLILVTARPEFSPPWSDYLHITTFNLNRFSRSLANAMVARVARGKALPDEVRDQIVEKTDGVPLFVEELTKTVLESGWLEERGDRYELTGPLPGLEIPSTLNDSLMARLDRLGATKSVAQTASAIGREFSYDLLAAVAPLDQDALGEALEQLVASELVFPHGRTTRSYIFKHALVLDAAYDSMLRKRRRELHGRIANAIRDGFPEIVAAQPEVLAYHYAGAGQTDKAIAYWLLAGQRATARSANREAVRHLQIGLEALNELSPSTERDRLELSLQIAMTTPMTAISGFASVESEKSYARARELCDSLGETEQLVTVLHGQWVRHTVTLGHCEATKIAAQLLKMGERQDNETALMMGHRLVAWNKLFRGHLEVVEPHIRKALAVYDSNPVKYRELRLRSHHDPRVASLSALAIQQWLSGFPERSVEAQEECIAHARDLDHAASMAYALFHAGCIPAALGNDPVTVRRLGSELTALATEQELATYTTNGSIIMGWVTGAIDDPATGIARMKEGFDIVGTGRFRYFLTIFLGLFARLNIQLGATRQALGTLAEASDLIDESDERLWSAEIHRLKGDALGGSEDGDGEAVQAEYEHALRIAASVGSKSLELRAATSLARLWARENRVGDARGLLGPIYEWFTEGFDTPDLKEARSVLEDLN